MHSFVLSDHIELIRHGWLLFERIFVELATDEQGQQLIHGAMHQLMHGPHDDVVLTEKHQ